MMSVEHMDELITRFKSGELDRRDIIEQSYFGGRADAYEECARIIENSKTLFENHQTETIMATKDKCIPMIRNSKEQK